MKIDWMGFKGNVARHKDYALGKSTADMIRRYGGEDGVYDDITEENVARWSRPADDQPTDEQRAILIEYMRHVLESKDGAYLYESMEGDYLEWDIHLAEKLELGMPLVADEWARFSDDALDGDLETADPDGPEMSMCIERIREELGEVIARYPAPTGFFADHLC
ncbi:MAG TPA: hypothetical protein VEA41_09870 [Salinarimonas sp.]|nr:hypothetical protein [Salinarimonas sp.]